MVRHRYSKLPGGSAGRRYRRPRQLLGGTEEQAAFPLGGKMHFSADNVQAKIDKWQAGADEIEAAMVKWRSHTHRFQAIGKLPACEKCGMPRGHTHNGKLIHLSG